MARDDSKSVKAERDAAAQAVIDNMAKLRAQRLAREALAPAVVAVKKKKATAATKPGSGKSGSKPAEKTPALAAWLAGQQSGGRRT